MSKAGPASRPVHPQEKVPGRRCPEGPPHPQPGGQGCLPGGRPASHNSGGGRASPAPEQRSGGRRLRGPALPGARPPSPSSWTPAPAFPIRNGGAAPGTRTVKPQWETKAQPTPRPDNSGPTTDARFRTVRGPGLSIHEAPPQRSRVTKRGWGERRTKELSRACRALHASHQHPPPPSGAHSPEAGPESLPGLRAGHPEAPRPAPPQVPTANKETRAGALTLPEPRLPRPGVAVRRGLGAAGRPDLPPRTRRLSGGPGPASDPSPPSPPPYSPGSILLPERPPSRGAAPTPPPRPEPPRAQPPRPTRSPEQAPCFCLGFRGPQGAGHVTLRGGILRFSIGFEK